MTSPLRLLVYGSLDSGVTDVLRVGAFVEPLAALGVEVRAWSSFANDLLNGGVLTGEGSRNRDPLLDAGLAALAWADVVLFRRWRSTSLVCTECEAAFGDRPTFDEHIRAAAHRTLLPDPMLRAVVALLVAHPELLGGRSVVYDTDDDVLAYPDWTGFGPASRRERDLVAGMLGLADLVTAATPVLADRLARHTRAPVRVVRNALEASWYPPVSERGSDEEVRIVYHGVPVRLRDYDVARPAVDRVAREMRHVRRVWLGAAHEPRIVAAVDEARPWIEGPAAFGRGLAASRPDIGLAPLRDEPFNRAKSELHWLEYSLVGAPVVATGFGGPGPYDVIRDGVDGLVAATQADWERHLRALVASPGLRSELAGRARERALADYSTARRAAEWADAYRWASDHAHARHAA